MENLLAKLLLIIFVNSEWLDFKLNVYFNKDVQAKQITVT